MSTTETAEQNTTHTLDAQAYHDMLHGMPAGFAVFEIVKDEQGKAHDLTLIDANQAFAEILNKQSGDIIGKNITKILPGIFTWEFDWIKALAAVAENSAADTIVDYAEGSVRKWLSMHATSTSPGIVAVLATDVTEEKRMQSALSMERNNLSY